MFIKDIKQRNGRKKMEEKSIVDVKIGLINFIKIMY